MATSFPDARRQVNACRGCFAFNVELQPVENNVAKLFAFMQGGKYVEVDEMMPARVCQECHQFLCTVDYFMLYCRRIRQMMSVLLRRETLPCDSYLQCLFDELLRLQPITDLEVLNLDLGCVILEIEATDFWYRRVTSKQTQALVDDIKQKSTIQDVCEASDVKIELKDQLEDVNISNDSVIKNKVFIALNSDIIEEKPSKIKGHLLKKTENSIKEKALKELKVNGDFDNSSDISEDLKSEGFNNDPNEVEETSQSKDESVSKKSRKKVIKTGKIKKRASKLGDSKKRVKNRDKNSERKHDKVKINKKDCDFLDFDQYSFGNTQIDPTKTKVIILTLEEQKADMEKRKEIGNYECSPHRCEFCYKSFTGPKTQSKHMKLHEESAGKFECPLCRLRFANGSLCRRHVLDTHMRRFRCLLCDNVSKSPGTMRTHQGAHSGKSYQCPDCGLTFRFPSSFYSHIRNNHPTDTVCDVCGEGVLGEFGLLLHKRKSHGIKMPRKRRVYRSGNRAKPSTDDLERENAHPESQRGAPEVKADVLPTWRCDDCRITFDTIESFQTHLVRSKKHGSQLKNSCIICKETFASSELCEEHLKTHITKAKKSREYYYAISRNHRFRCKSCGQTFKSQKLLSEHERAHETEGPLACHACQKEFPTKLLLRAHYKYCVWPEKHARTNNNEKKFCCEFCDKRFMLKGNLTIHLRVHTGVKPYQCEVCSKMFSIKPNLERHMLVHTGEKPHQCLQCGKCFAQTSSVKLHVRTVHMKMRVERKVKKRRWIQTSKNQKLRTNPDQTVQEANATE